MTLRVCGVQVDQVLMREPWMVEIYDFAGRLHEVQMAPGDIVYYEVRDATRAASQPTCFPGSLPD